MRTRNDVIILDEYEFKHPVGVIDYIVKLHNQGMNYKDIARKLRFRQMEVILVLLHVADVGKDEIASIFDVLHSSKETKR